MNDQVLDRANRKKMKYAVTITDKIGSKAPLLLEGDPRDTIKRAAELGYDGVELHWAKPSLIDIERISSCCKQNQIEISAFGTGQSYTKEGLSLIDDDEVIRKSAINRLKEFVDLASPFGSTVVIGCIRGNIPEGSRMDDYLARLAESTIEVAEYAESKGVPIVFEAINRYENNYLNNALETLEFIQKNKLPNTKLLLDTFHMNIEDQDMRKSILACKDMIGYMHFADSNRWHVGAGHISFREIMDSLKEIEYSGFISAECLPLPNSDIAAQNWIGEVKRLQ